MKFVWVAKLVTSNVRVLGLSFLRPSSCHDWAVGKLNLRLCGAVQRLFFGGHRYGTVTLSIGSGGNMVSWLACGVSSHTRVFDWFNYWHLRGGGWPWMGVFLVSDELNVTRCGINILIGICNHVICSSQTSGLHVMVFGWFAWWL